jgi:hypothetical protein
VDEIGILFGENLSSNDVKMSSNHRYFMCPELGDKMDKRIEVDPIPGSAAAPEASLGSLPVSSATLSLPSARAAGSSVDVGIAPPPSSPQQAPC